jgi:hypothetical protein
MIGILLLVVGGLVVLKEWNWAFLYKINGCSHCHEIDCHCGRCPLCNHYIGFTLSSTSHCKICSWRNIVRAPRYNGDSGPAYPGQTTDYLGLGPGGGNPGGDHGNGP